MAKLQKQVAYKYKGHAIYKYRINLPSEVVESVGWKEGTEVEFDAKGKTVEMRAKAAQ
ncbi:MAG: AbrB/MazE/SpoVT family DNA-binding domain-containing protein [Nitrososphaerales archaeon]